MSESDNFPEPAGWDGEDRPWERPGGFRRDYPPHRAPLLRAVGLAALALGLASLCCPLLAALTAWPALGVSLVACWPTETCGRWKTAAWTRQGSRRRFGAGRTA
jgi:hypothetical protein